MTPLVLCDRSRDGLAFMRRSAHQVRFLHPLGWSYYATLRRKLRWHAGVS